MAASITRRTVPVCLAFGREEAFCKAARLSAFCGGLHSYLEGRAVVSVLAAYGGISGLVRACVGQQASGPVGVRLGHPFAPSLRFRTLLPSCEVQIAPGLH